MLIKFFQAGKQIIKFTLPTTKCLFGSQFDLNSILNTNMVACDAVTTNNTHCENFNATTVCKTFDWNVSACTKTSENLLNCTLNWFHNLLREHPDICPSKSNCEKNAAGDIIFLSISILILLFALLIIGRFIFDGVNLCGETFFTINSKKQPINKNTEKNYGTINSTKEDVDHLIKNASP